MGVFFFSCYFIYLEIGRGKGVNFDNKIEDVGDVFYEEEGVFEINYF